MLETSRNSAIEEGRHRRPRYRDDEQNEMNDELRWNQRSVFEVSDRVAVVPRLGISVLSEFRLAAARSQ